MQVFEVARVGVEPTGYRYRRILSPLRLPVPPPSREVYSTQTLIKVKIYKKTGRRLSGTPRNF